ncbi:MAG: SDR family oxidoreductase [Pelagibacteraceae bacterium]|nr:SDR family oxidoreductase [Pelagibacteraceae bacterium]
MCLLKVLRLTQIFFSFYRNKHFIFISSVSAARKKQGPYGQSKKLAEEIVQRYVAKGLNATIVSPSFVIGPGEIDSSRYLLAKSISKGRVTFTFPGGGGTVGIEDLVDGIVLAMKWGKSGERYILSNENVFLIDRFNLMAKILNKPKIKYIIPRFTYYLMYFLGVIVQKLVKNPPISTEIVRWYFNYRNFDNSKAKQELGWKPKTSLKESIRRTIEYYKSIKVL